jgi:Domain of unknown function (DUF4136)
MKKLLLISLLALASGCAARPTIHTNVDKTADLSAFRTYGFVPELGTTRAGYSSLVTTYFKDAIRREMESRGYRYVDEQPDLMVNFSANARENVDIRSTPGPTLGYYGYRAGLYGVGPIYGGTQIDTVRYKVGTANIDVVDARRRQLIWEGVVEGKLTEKVMRDPQAAINTVVTEMFSRFPGRAAS